MMFKETKLGNCKTCNAPMVRVSTGLQFGGHLVFKFVCSAEQAGKLHEPYVPKPMEKTVKAEIDPNRDYDREASDKRLTGEL